jgi:hypothetical protein
MTTPTAPELSPDSIATYLDEAKRAIASAFAAHDVTLVLAEVSVFGTSKLITDFKACRRPDGTVDLAATPPIASGIEEHHRTFDHVQALAEDFILTTLRYRSDPFLTSGKVTLHADGDLAQPIDWAAKSAHEREERKKAIRARTALIATALKDLGADAATITYDGEGDSGQIEDISARTAANAEVDLNVPLPDPGNPERFTSLRNALNDLAWQALDALHSGYELGSGGFGEIVLSVRTATLTVEHSDRIYDVTTTTTEI